MSEPALEIPGEPGREESRKPAVRRGRRLSDLLWHLRAIQPCTLRGLLAIALSTVAVRTLAIAEYDLVANILGWSILTLAGATFLGVVFLRFRLSGSLDATAHFSALAVHSRRPVPGGLTLRQSSIPPFFALEVRRIFAHPGVLSPVHVVNGYQSQDAPRILVDSVVFPHRGLWSLRYLEFRISDALGLCSLRWRLPLDYQIQVTADTIPIEPLPIVASSHRSGEDLSTSAERTGDLFDIKAYDPSDGIKRILWKTYARSGELVSRRPEPASIPDGELAIFLVAEKSDDVAAGALQDYLEQLRRHDIEILFGTDSMFATDEESRSGVGYLTHAAQIQEAIDGDVWHPVCGTGKGIVPFLEALDQRGRSLEQIVVFVAAENEEWISKTLPGLAKFPIRGFIAAVDTAQFAELGYNKDDITSAGAVERLAQRLMASRLEVHPVRARMRLS